MTNPTEKGGEAPGHQPPVTDLAAKCPYCAEAILGLNVITIALPTPPESPAKGNLMTFLAACCPHCAKPVPVQFIGYQAPAPGAVATPPGNLWKPS
jgi:hypothetical protein